MDIKNSSVKEVVEFFLKEKELKINNLKFHIDENGQIFESNEVLDILNKKVTGKGFLSKIRFLIFDFKYIEEREKKIKEEGEEVLKNFLNEC